MFRSLRLCQSLPSALVLILVLNGIHARADDPLHVRIDKLIAAKANGQPAAALASDAEFLRRAYLDFAGQIPSVEAARAFLADSTADKRQKLIDQLLSGPEYPRRMSEAFDVMLMERLGENPEWSTFLRFAFESDMPWDEIVRNISHPDTENEQTRGAAFFLTKRLENYGQNPVDLPALTRDMGRLFLGVDLQCAQCHDHPHIQDYKQHDFQGIFAFVGHAFIRSDKKFPAVGEKVVNAKIEFESVFIPGKKQTGPRLPGSTEIEIPQFKKDEEFAMAPDRKANFPGIPKFSPLTIMAEQLPSRDNNGFAANAANRLWFLLMGRGIVDPLDMRHSGNPPSHPELLELLADEFAQHKFSIKFLLREIALSETYQRSSLLPPGVSEMPANSFLVALERPLSAEQLMWSMLQATGEWQEVVPSTPADAPAAAVSAEAATEKKRDQKPEPLKENPKLADYRSRFTNAFANPPREPEGEFAPSVKAALFVLNDSAVLGWLSAKPGNLVDRLSKTTNYDALADELYLSVLSRTPTGEERAAVAEYLAKFTADQRTKAIGDLAWSLLASTEFCVNH